MAAFRWQEIKRLSNSRQVKFFTKTLRKQPIRSFSDIKKGDHIARLVSRTKGFRYHHHMLCIGHGEHRVPLVIHLSGGAEEASSNLMFNTSKDFGVVAKVRPMSLKDDMKNEADLEKYDACRIVWSEGVRRYSVVETIKRAHRRLRDSGYDLRNNNCEHFVMWCMCGIGLQVGRLEVGLVNAAECTKNDVPQVMAGAFVHAVGEPVTKEMLNQAGNGAMRAAKIRSINKAAMKGAVLASTSSLLSVLPPRAPESLGEAVVAVVAVVAVAMKVLNRAAKVTVRDANAYTNSLKFPVMSADNLRAGAEFSHSTGKVLQDILPVFDIAHHNVHVRGLFSGKCMLKWNLQVDPMRTELYKRAMYNRLGIPESSAMGDKVGSRSLSKAIDFLIEAASVGYEIYQGQSSPIEVLSGCGGRVGGGALGQMLVPIPWLGYTAGAMIGDRAARFTSKFLFEKYF